MVGGLVAGGEFGLDVGADLGEGGVERGLDLGGGAAGEPPGEIDGEAVQGGEVDAEGVAAEVDGLGVVHDGGGVFIVLDLFVEGLKFFAVLGPGGDAVELEFVFVALVIAGEPGFEGGEELVEVDAVVGVEAGEAGGFEHLQEFFGEQPGAFGPVHTGEGGKIFFGAAVKAFAEAAEDAAEGLLEVSGAAAERRDVAGAGHLAERRLIAPGDVGDDLDARGGRAGGTEKQRIICGGRE